VNAGTDQKWTSLHLAAKEQNTGVVRVLLDNDADGALKDSYGATPLHYAVQLADLNHFNALHSVPRCIVKGPDKKGAVPNLLRLLRCLHDSDQCLHDADQCSARSMSPESVCCVLGTKKFKELCRPVLILSCSQCQAKGNCACLQCKRLPSPHPVEECATWWTLEVAVVPGVRS